MNDRRKMTLMLAALITTLAAVLLVAAVPSYAGTWLQQYGKTTDTCEEGWGTSWAEWFNGPVCTREVDDPSQPVAAAPDPTPTGPPWPSGREFLYAGGSIVNGVLSGGSGYTYVSTPFNICTTWQAARVTSANGLVVPYFFVDNAYVQVYNPGNQTTVSIYVTCA